MVKVGEGEMPEGAVSSDDDRKESRPSVGKDKVVDALDQNLDM